MFHAFLFRSESPSAPQKPGMAWALRMDESPNPGENKEPGARLGRITSSG
jgi:hypothetical protein